MARKYAFVLLILVAVASSAVSYPISPQTLWQLAEDADIVVVAEVEDVKGLRLQSRDSWYSHRARLKVVEQWKGESAEILKVKFAGNLACPAPPRYIKGERVLAFLKTSKDGLFTVGLSYGTLYPAGAELADYRDAVRSALALHGGLLESRTPTESERLEWLVEAASRPGTRWSGLYELVAQGDSLHSYYDQDSQRLKGAKLTDSQRHRVLSGFVSAPRVDRTIPMMLKLAKGLARDDFDRVVTAAMEALIQMERRPYWLRDALPEYLARFGDKDPKARIKTLGDDFDAERLQSF